jgi:cytochrome b pre-mRNA-processing protein 3
MRCQQRESSKGLRSESTMLWPFKQFWYSRAAPRGTIEAIYGMIVTQARHPLFYEGLGVPDTIDGRFDLLVLHLWLVLRRLRREERGAQLAQALFDRFCEDMDANLREMGVGDFTVPKRMQAFGEAFYGRTAAYDIAFGEAGEALAQALCRNILSGARIENAGRLAAYSRAANSRLAELDSAALLAGSWKFPQPPSERAEHEQNGQHGA